MHVHVCIVQSPLEQQSNFMPPIRVNPSKNAYNCAISVSERLYYKINGICILLQSSQLIQERRGFSFLFYLFIFSVLNLYAEESGLHGRNRHLWSEFIITIKKTFEIK